MSKQHSRQDRDGGQHARTSSHSRGSLGRPAGGHLGSSVGSSGFVSPTMMAASLRSVLSHMSADELTRYKAAFQSYDADADGYLNLAQAVQALQACGVQVTGGDMLDNLDDLEEAQEDGLDQTPWEQEQNRRRRRRRRFSLEQMESLDSISHVTGGHGTGQPACKIEPDDRAPADCPPPPALSRAVSLENAPKDSSLKVPAIDISTFLNLARAPNAPVSLGAQPKSVSQLANISRPNTQPAPAFPSSKNPSYQSSSHHAGANGGHEWEHAGYQVAASSAAGAASANGQPGRPYSSVSSDSKHDRSVSSDSHPGTQSPPRGRYPNLRLRDHAPSQPQLVHSSSGVHASATSAGSRRNLGLPPLVGDDLDDDFDFDPQEDLLAAFHTFDPTKSGVMSIKNLLAIMCNLGEKWSEEDALEMAEQVDVKREGRFNYHQLVKKLVM